MIHILNTIILSYVISSCNLPTKYGLFNLDIHRVNKMDIPVLSSNYNFITNNSDDINESDKKYNVLVRVHDACMTSEIFSSLRCDCDEQLKLTMKILDKHGGLIIYAPNEGRGIGLANKVKAYNIQDKYTLDTYQANKYLELPEDCRDYSYVPDIIKQYNIETINLLTNSRIKHNRLQDFGLNIVKTMPVLIPSNKYNKKYMYTKRKMNIQNIEDDDVYCSIETAIEELQKNKPIIITDDEDRENEGDLVYPAETITQQGMSFMIKHTSGLICCAMSYDMINNLKLPLMIKENDNTDVHHTAFTVSVDYKFEQETGKQSTGISASDRAMTCNKLCKDGITLDNFTMPGHMFPLRAHKDGLDKREGHTEASTKICEMAGFKPAAVISEITSEDKMTMANREELEQLARKYSLKIISIKQLSFMRKVNKLS